MRATAVCLAFATPPQHSSPTGAPHMPCRCQQLLRFFPKSPLLRLLAQPWTGGWQGGRAYDQSCCCCVPGAADTGICRPVFPAASNNTTQLSCPPAGDISFVLGASGELPACKGAWFHACLVQGRLHYGTCWPAAGVTTCCPAYPPSATRTYTCFYLPVSSRSVPPQNVGGQLHEPRHLPGDAGGAARRVG